MLIVSFGEPTSTALPSTPDVSEYDVPAGVTPNWLLPGSTVLPPVRALVPERRRVAVGEPVNEVEEA